MSPCPDLSSAGGECQFQSGQERSPASYNFTLEFRVFEDDWTAAWISMILGNVHDMITDEMSLNIDYRSISRHDSSILIHLLIQEVP